jgi:hypothetical protein
MLTILCLIGPSSTISFLRQVLKSIDSHDTSYVESHLESIKPECSPPSSLFCSQPEVSTRSASEDNLDIFPTYSSTILLVSIYFRGYGSINPFLNDITFIRTHVKDVYESKQRPRASRLALLNMVLAIACTTSIDSTYTVERWIRLSRTFYRRARGLYVKDIFQSPDLDLSEFTLPSDGCRSISNFNPKYSPDVSPDDPIPAQY